MDDVNIYLTGGQNTDDDEMLRSSGSGGDHSETTGQYASQTTHGTFTKRHVTNKDGGDEKLNIYIIIIAVAGAVLLLAFVASFVVMWFKRRQLARSKAVIPTVSGAVNNASHKKSKGKSQEVESQQVRRGVITKIPTKLLPRAPVTVQDPMMMEDLRTVYRQTSTTHPSPQSCPQPPLYEVPVSDCQKEKVCSSPPPQYDVVIANIEGTSEYKVLPDV